MRDVFSSLISSLRSARALSVRYQPTPMIRPMVVKMTAPEGPLKGSERLYWTVPKPDGGGRSLARSEGGEGQFRSKASDLTQTRNPRNRQKKSRRTYCLYGMGEDELIVSGVREEEEMVGWARSSGPDWRTQPVVISTEITQP